MKGMIELFIVLMFLGGWGVLEFVTARMDRRRERAGGEPAAGEPAAGGPAAGAPAAGAPATGAPAARDRPARAPAVRSAGDPRHAEGQ
jgi:hypothetical protein